MGYSVGLRLYRLTRGLSQRDVADLMGLKDPGLISRWENGFSLPDLKNAFKLAAVYGVAVGELFSDLDQSSLDLGGQGDGAAPVRDGQAGSGALNAKKSAI